MGGAKIWYVLNLPTSDDLATDLARFDLIVWPDWSVGEDNMALTESRL